MGIINWPAAIPDRLAMRSTTGMKMATTPVELITDPRKPTASIRSTRRRQALSPPRVTSQSPMVRATPVRASASPTTNIAPISTTFGLAKPAIRSGLGLGQTHGAGPEAPSNISENDGEAFQVYTAETFDQMSSTMRQTRVPC